jgi:hypothetical protein
MGKSKGKIAVTKPRRLSTRSSSDSSGGSGIGGGSTAFNRRANTGRSDGDGGVDGRRSDRHDHDNNTTPRNTTQYENDLLHSLEESLDWHNQTTGFVSSYTVPLAHNVDSSTPVASNSAARRKIDAVTLVQAIPSQDQLNYLLKSTSSSSVSPIINYDGIQPQPNHLVIRREMSDNNLRDIFRPPSRSPSTSPKARARSNSDQHLPSLGLAFAAAAAATSDNSGIIHDNTSTTSLGGGKRRSPIPTRAPPPLPPVNKFNYNNNTDKQRTTTILPGDDNEEYRIDPSHNTQMKTSRTSPLRGIHIPISASAIIDIDSDIKRAINTKIKRKSKPKIKKNNLVIQPAAVSVSLPQQKKQLPPQRNCKPHSPPTTMLSPSPSTMSSRMLLPPTHPFSQIQSYPSQDSTSPLRTNNRHARSNSVASAMSDYSSAAESEATPQVRGGRRGGGLGQGVFGIVQSGAKHERGGEDDDDDVGARQGQEQYNKPNMTFSFSDDEEDDDFNQIHGTLGTPVSTQLTDRLSSTELRGIDISFALQEEATKTATAEGHRLKNITALPLVPADVVTTAAYVESNTYGNHRRTSTSLEVPFLNDLPQQYDTDGDQNETSSLDGSASQVSQFSSDDRFFEGIHNSGLQSLSFEQVAENDFNTCMDVEIEMVYNTGSMSFDTADNNSVVSDDDKVLENGSSAQDSTETRKEMEKRILQWRRGRHAWMKNSEESLCEKEKQYRHPPPVQRQQLAIDTKKSEKYEDDTDIEMAPLVSGSGHANNNGNHGKQLQHQLGSAITPKRVNSYSHLQHSTNDEEEDGEDYDDGDEFTGLTTPKHYSRPNDIPVIHCCGNRCYCCFLSFMHREFCCCMNNRIFQNSGWKKLLFVSSCFMLLAWVFTGGNLEKHHNEPSSKFNESNDPLARNKMKDDFYALHEYSDSEDDVADWQYKPDRVDGSASSAATNNDHQDHANTNDDPFARDSIVENSRIIDDGDDFTATGEGPNGDGHDIDSEDDVVDWQYQTDRVDGSTSSAATNNDHHGDTNINGDPLARNSIVENSRIIDDGDDFIATGEGPNGDGGTDYANNQQHQTANSPSAIDTIVVLGGCERRPSPMVDWMVDRLKRLYPDYNVLDGFPIEDIDNTEPTQRMMHLSADHSTPRLMTNKDEASQQVLSSSNTIVVAALINPYSWVEFMRVDSQEDLDRDHILGWREFVEEELPSINGTILDLRAACIQSTILSSSEQEDVEVVFPVRYEDMVDPYRDANFSSTSTPLPGLVGLVEQIQNRTGLRPVESAGWMESSIENNDFLADPVVCMNISCFASMHNSSDDASYIRYVNEHVDWSVEKLVGYQKWSVPKPDVDQIVILGERHNGAEWLVERLARCFPTVPVRYGLSRPGKWFQSAPEEPLPQTLIVSVFLNPHDWVELMRQYPINAPAHKDMEWHEFVLSSWERERSDLDKAISDTTHVNCSFGFYFEEVIPCMTKRDPQSDAFPLYELHPLTSGSRAGDPYASILELRADKIRNFLGAATFEGVVDSILVHYEDLVWDDDYLHLSKPYPGISGLLEEIDDRTNLVPDVNAGWFDDGEDYFKAKALGIGTMKLDPYYVQWMDEHVDWDVEMLVGYNP